MRFLQSLERILTTVYYINQFTSVPFYYIFVIPTFLEIYFGSLLILGLAISDKKLFRGRRNIRNNWFVPAEFRLFRGKEKSRNSVPNHAAEKGCSNKLCCICINCLDGRSHDTMGWALEISSFLGPKWSSPIRCHFTGPKQLSNSRAQPPPTCPRNGYARIQNIMHGAV
jgi:hypothetical protein